MTIRRVSEDEYVLDFPRFGIDSSVETCQSGYVSDDCPECEFDMGDENGLCIKTSYGCYYVGCEHSDD